MSFDILKRYNAYLIPGGKVPEEMRGKVPWRVGTSFGMIGPDKEVVSDDPAKAIQLFKELMDSEGVEKIEVVKGDIMVFKTGGIVLKG